MAAVALIALLCFASVTALTKEELYNTLSSKLGYDNVLDDNEMARLFHSSKIIDVDEIYVPSRDNVFHLFTRQNPTVSQPILRDYPELLAQTNFSPNRRTVYLIHGYQGSTTSTINTVLVPAYLQAGDVNVILVDWSRGADSSIALSVIYSKLAAINIARFGFWLSGASGQALSEVQLVGTGLSGLMAGQIGRLLDRQIGFIAALDPSMGPRIQELLPQVRPNDAIYTEVVHTNVGNLGYIKPMGQVDFYPNGGIIMPGCGRNDECDRDRAIFYWAESLTSGGFTGRQCQDWEQALEEECEGPTTLQMGGLNPKTGSSGIFSVPTNAGPPFSLGDCRHYCPAHTLSYQTSIDMTTEEHINKINSIMNEI